MAATFTAGEVGGIFAATGFTFAGELSGTTLVGTFAFVLGSEPGTVALAAMLGLVLADELS